MMSFKQVIGPSPQFGIQKYNCGHECGHDCFTLSTTTPDQEHVHSASAQAYRIQDITDSGVSK